jgi:DNA-binding CsgD family transcriptional regulator
MNDLFLTRLDQRLERRNRLLRNNINTWIEILDSLGWCVAIAGGEQDGVQLSLNAVAELKSRGLVEPNWEQLGQALRAVPPAIHPVDDPAMQVWAAACATHDGGIPVAPALTPREAEVLRWLREGKTNEEISIILGCTRRTVEGHGLRLYRKLGIHTRLGVHLLERQTRGQPASPA